VVAEVAISVVLSGRHPISGAAYSQWRLNIGLWSPVRRELDEGPQDGDILEDAGEYRDALLGEGVRQKAGIPVLVRFLPAG
jgi:hypothetical protein